MASFVENMRYGVTVDGINQYSLRSSNLTAAFPTMFDEAVRRIDDEMCSTNGIRETFRMKRLIELYKLHKDAFRKLFFET